LFEVKNRWLRLEFHLYSSCWSFHHYGTFSCTCKHQTAAFSALYMGFFSEFIQVSCAFGQTAPRIFMSTTGGDGPPFVSRINDMQGFSLIVRIKIASPTETKYKNNQSQDIFHQKSSPI